MTLAQDLGLWFWRLLPANPILVRVVSAGGKRTRHLLVRVVYLLILFIVMLIAGKASLTSASLADLAKQSSQTFMAVSIVQLFLMSFIAPVFTAGAITQEKDANTFHILLTTPLSNAQIVLGTLLSRIFFVWALLLSGLPIFCITMIFGGVTTAEVFQSFGLAAGTALVTGSLAILISVARVGTRRTIFSFFVGVAVYLLGILSIGLSPWGQLAVAPPGTGFFGTGRQVSMSWLAPVHPFLALAAVTGQTPPPAPEAVYVYGWPWRWLLAYPQYGYMVLTTLASIVMVLLSLFFVRRGSKDGESTLATRLRAFLQRGEPGERRRRPRHVWNNPIAWREASTRASAGGRSAMRWVFLAGGVLAGLLLLIAYRSGWWGFNPADPTTVRGWLKTVVWIELAVILLVVTNTAATTLTREKEAQTMELLLTTPLTSFYIIAGMLRGLVSFVLPLIAVPTATLLLFILADLIPGAPDVVAMEALLLAPVLMIAFSALAAIVGLQFSLTSRKTVQAVMVSTGIVMGAAGLFTACGMTMAVANETLAAIILPFTPFPAIAALIDPASLFDASATPIVGQLIEIRILRAVSSLVAAGAYAFLTYFMYKNMVRSFDMIVRRQSA